jgi:hypothetical protein
MTQGRTFTQSPESGMDIHLHTRKKYPIFIRGNWRVPVMVFRTGTISTPKMTSSTQRAHTLTHLRTTRQPSGQLTSHNICKGGKTYSAHTTSVKLSKPILPVGIMRAHLDALIYNPAGIDGGLQVARVPHHVRVWEVQSDLGPHCKV